MVTLSKMLSSLEQPEKVNLKEGLADAEGLLVIPTQLL